MVGFINNSSATTYEPTPEGQHIFVCSRVIDLGTQPGSQMYPDAKRKIRIYWELPELPPVEWEDNGVKTTGPVLHVESYTASFNEKANLRKMLESWRGKPFADEDFAGPPNGFHLKKLLGIPAIGQIAHTVKDQNTYANLQSIMSLRGDERTKYHGKVSEKIFFSLDEFDANVFDKLHERVKEKIASSPEYKKLVGASAASTAVSEKPDAPIQFDDNIPF